MLKALKWKYVFSDGEGGGGGSRGGRKEEAVGKGGFITHRKLQIKPGASVLIIFSPA